MTITAKLCIIALLALIVAPVLATGPIRPTTTTTFAPMANPQYTNVTNAFGSNTSYTGIPNFGAILSASFQTYIDKTGTIGWVIIMAIPFLMMWIVAGDLAPAAITGILCSAYVFARTPNTEVIALSIAGIAIFIAALLYSLYRRSY